jgi:hypothetical protein
MRRSLLVLSVVVLLVACGSETAPSSTADGKKYVAAIMTSYRSSNARNAFTPTEARCITEAAVDAVGIDALKAAKVQPSDLESGSAFQTLGRKLSKSSVDKVSAAIVDAHCIDVGTVLLRSGAGDGAAFSQIGKAKVRCVFRRLGVPVAAQRAFADSLLGLPRSDAEFTASFRKEAVLLHALTKCKVDPSQIK